MRTGRFGEQQTHGVTLVSERGLNSNEDISELLSVYNKVLSIRVQVSGCGSPVLLEVLSVRSQLVVFFGTHAVSNIELGRGNPSFRVVQDRLHDCFLIQWCISNIISLRLHLSQDSLDGIKHIEVCGSSYVTLIRGEREDGNCNLLVLCRLGSKGGPLHCAVCQQIYTVGKRNTASGSTFTSSKDNGLNCSINFREGYLQGNLHRV